MGKYPIGEKAKDLSIKAVSLLFGTVHFTARLAADAAREGEAQIIHLMDKGCDVSMIRKRRDKSYEDKMQDVADRIAETRKVMDETYERMTHKMSTEEVVFLTETVAPGPPES